MSKPLIALLPMLCVLSFSSFGQDQHSITAHQALKKNTLHATAGFAGLMGGYNLNYERLIISFEEGQAQGLWARATTGGWGVWSSGGPYQAATLVLLTGSRSSHLELNAGIGRMVDKQGYEHAQHMSRYFSEPMPFKSSHTYFRPVGAVGYRYQKPDGRFIFRTGIAYPETVFLGFGVAL